MNKKFTFVVAALLAAGGFSANAQVAFDKVESQKYYHVYLSADGAIDDDNDTQLLMSVNKNNGAIVYHGVAAEDGNDLWKVIVKTTDGKTEVTLKNKKTGLELAYGKPSGSEDFMLLNNEKQYQTATDIDKTLDLSGENGLKFANTDLAVLVNKSLSTKTKVLLAEPASEQVTDLSKLVNLGAGINLTFAGTPTGTDVFENVTVVPVSAPNSKDEFYLVKGTPVYKTDGSLDKEKNTFVVLSATSGITGQEAPNGYKYTTVKGDKFVAASSSVESGKYPEVNAKFQAYENTNETGKIALAQIAVQYVENDTWKGTKEVWVSATGNTGAALVNAQTEKENAAWLTPSLGTAVDVKTLVKGQWVVNILASEDKNSTEMKKVVYAHQSSNSFAAITSSTTNTNKHKDAVYAQWIVSADKDANTVTFINRETGAEIKKVTLFKTPKANVYTITSTGTETEAQVKTDEETPKAYDLNKGFIELRTVENTTQWDSYLNLDKEALDSEYTLSVDNSTLFDKIEAGVIANGANIVKTNDKNAKLLTFKLAPSKTKINNVEKADTVFVNTVKYGFYKDGKFTEASDTLKAISYNFASLKNAGKITVNTEDKAYVGVKEDFTMFYDGQQDVTSGKFMLRKVGDRYQIEAATTKDKYANNYIKYDKAASKFANGAFADASKFALNAVEVAPSYDMPESHVALEINGAYLGSKADGNAIMTNDTLMLKSTAVDAAFSFYAFSADTVEAKTPSYYLSSNGKMMYSTQEEYAALKKQYDALSPVFDEAERAEIKAKMDALMSNGAYLVKFQQAKYVDAKHIALANDTVEGDALKSYKFNVFDVDGQAVLKNANSDYVQVLNDVVVFTSDIKKAAKFDVVAAEAPTSNEGVSATEVKVVANNGSIVVKNAAGKNVVVSTILGQVVANEVLTSDNATINVPAGIVVVSVEGESFKVNVK